MLRYCDVIIAILLFFSKSFLYHVAVTNPTNPYPSLKSNVIDNKNHYSFIAAQILHRNRHKQNRTSANSRMKNKRKRSPHETCIIVIYFLLYKWAIVGLEIISDPRTMPRVHSLDNNFRIKYVIFCCLGSVRDTRRLACHCSNHEHLIFIRKYSKYLSNK